jgi:hypothetical protein
VFHSKWQIPLGVLVTALFVLCLPGAMAAGGGCGDVERTTATLDVNPSGLEPLAVGDSVMLLAVNDLAAVGYNTNSQGCRSFAAGLGVVRATKNRGRLPHLVVLALGTDGRISEAAIKRALRVVGPHRVLGLVTPRELSGQAGFDAITMRRAAKENPTRIVLFDWVKYSAGHSDWFQPDRSHLTYAGATAFAQLLAKGTGFSKPNQFPNGTRFAR